MLHCDSRNQGCDGKSLAMICDFELRFPSPKPLSLWNFCDLTPPSTQRSTAIAIMRFWFAKAGKCFSRQKSATTKFGRICNFYSDSSGGEDSERGGKLSKNAVFHRKLRDRNFANVIWRVPNPPGANPLVAERAPWRSSQSCVTGGQQTIGNPYRFLSFLLHTWQPLCDPNSHSWGRLFQLPGG